MKLTKMIYIASPYSSYHWLSLINWFIEFIRYRQITKIIGRLQDKFPYAFIGPITQSHHTSKYMKSNCGLFIKWRRRDLTYISRCDEVWVVKMPGWKESFGVQSEIKFAKENKIVVQYIEPTSLKFTKD